MAADSPGPGGRGWTRGEALVVAAGALLVLDLLLAPWHRFAIDVNLEQFGVELPSFRLDRHGVQNPQAFFGIASAVIAALMAIHIVATKVLSSVPRSEEFHLVAGAVVLGLVIAKLLANNDFLAIGAWLGIALAAALAYGGFLLSQETSAGTGRTVSTS
jgi:hypothetical protein